MNDEEHASCEQTSVDNVKVLNLDNVAAYETEGGTAVVDEVATVRGHQVVYKVVVWA